MTGLMSLVMFSVWVAVIALERVTTRRLHSQLLEKRRRVDEVLDSARRIREAATSFYRQADKARQASLRERAEHRCMHCVRRGKGASS